MSIASKINGNDFEMSKLKKSVDSCNALQETNITALIETKKILTEHDARFAMYESQFHLNGQPNLTLNLTNGELKKNIEKVEEDFGKLFGMILQLLRNVTIKTHFYLKDAYNKEL